MIAASALGGVDDLDDVPVAQRLRAGDEHRLVLAGLEDAAEHTLELRHGDVLLVDRDAPVGGVFDDDLTDVDFLLLLRRLGFGGQVDVDALLRQRQRRHEDDEQHEQHVDQRRHVHVRVGMRGLGGDDLLGAEVLVCVRHY
jgi:hypothetical protein